MERDESDRSGWAGCRRMGLAKSWPNARVIKETKSAERARKAHLFLLGRPLDETHWDARLVTQDDRRHALILLAGMPGIITPDHGPLHQLERSLPDLFLVKQGEHRFPGIPKRSGLVVAAAPVDGRRGSVNGLAELKGGREARGEGFRPG